MCHPHSSPGSAQQVDQACPHGVHGTHTALRRGGQQRHGAQLAIDRCQRRGSGEDGRSLGRPSARRLAPAAWRTWVVGLRGKPGG